MLELNLKTREIRYQNAKSIRYILQSSRSNGDHSIIIIVAPSSVCSSLMQHRKKKRQCAAQEI
jgi:hypothetical protein